MLDPSPGAQPASSLHRFKSATLAAPAPCGERQSADYRADDDVARWLAQALGGSAASIASAEAPLAASGDLVVIGSPRFNPVADQLQHVLGLHWQYVTARSTGDAATRDDRSSLSRTLRVISLVSDVGDALSASGDSLASPGAADDADESGVMGAHASASGVDYGMVVYARLEGGRQVLWLSGIRATGVRGALRCLIEHPALIDRMADAIASRGPASDVIAVTQVVRVAGTASLTMLDELRLSTAPARRTTARGLLVDLGDVVMRFDRDRGYRAIADLQGRQYRDVRDAVHGDARARSLVAAYESGRLETVAFCRALSALLGGSAELATRLPACWADIFWPNAEMIEVLGGLKRSGVVLGLVSNTNAVHIDWLTRHYPDVLSLFDERSLSFEVGAAKPEAPIFLDALDRMQRRGLARDALLYVDDLAPYVRAMQALGVAGFTYRSHPHFVLWLRQRGLTVPTVPM